LIAAAAFSADIALAGGAAQTIAWDTAPLNDGAAWDAAAPTRLTVGANWPALVEVSAQIIAGSSAAHWAVATLLQNGVAVAALSRDAVLRQAFTVTTGFLPVVPGDWFELSFQREAGASDLLAAVECRISMRGPAALSACRAVRGDLPPAPGGQIIDWAGAAPGAGWSPAAPQLMIAPPGTRAAVVSLSGVYDAYAADPGTETRILRDGEIVARWADATSRWGALAPHSTLIPITAGQALSVWAATRGTITGASLAASVAWIA
jgi:hypothetical protein